MTEKVLNLGADAAQEPSFVSRATDPVVTNVATPGDFLAQFPQPLNTDELVAMCDEVNVWRSLPEIGTALKSETWRELNELAFTSGSSYITFSDGTCPEEYTHDGDNQTIDLKNIGAKKSLTIADILHSAAVAAANWNGINNLVGPFSFGEGMPGGQNAASMVQQAIPDLKAKEMELGSILVMNGWDRLLVLGDVDNNALEFDGIEQRTVAANGARVDVSSASGTFTAQSFDRFLSAGCAKPQRLYGHPQAIQELMGAYFQLGWQGSQSINLANGERVIPGFNFAGEVNTGVGRLQVVADANFTRTEASGNNSSFQSRIYALRMSHNGLPLVYKRTQIPLSFKDLAPGCTAISFQLWARTALIMKAMCSQASYLSLFSGAVTATCPRIGV